MKRYTGPVETLFSNTLAVRLSILGRDDGDYREITFSNVIAG